MSLERFGWDAFFSEAFQRYSQEHLIAGRIYRGQHGRHQVWTGQGEIETELSGRFRQPGWQGSDDPVVGDWVVVRPDPPRIEAVLPRKTKFSRKQAGARTEEQILAANIDVLFLVTGLDRDFNLRRLERYLVLAWESGASPVIVLNKADLSVDPGHLLREVRSVAVGAPVFLVSALTGMGMDDLESQMLAGHTAALIGSSGAGKSTIVNRLLGYEAQRVQEVVGRDGRGRHTTTHRELILMPGGWLLMDLPGIRELQLWGEEDSVGRTFPDIEALAAQCRFRDCRHQGEPGCAIRDAEQQGAIDSARLGSYLKLRREIEHLERKQDQRSALEEKRRIKQLHRRYRQTPHR